MCASGNRSRSKLDRRQCEDEIANRAAADDQNAIHRFRSERAYGQYRIDREGRESPRRRASRGRVSSTPARRAARAPVDLVAQQVRHRYPEQPGHDQQIGEHRHEQAGSFRSEKMPHRAAAPPQADKESRARGRREIHRRTARRENIRSADMISSGRRKAGKFAHLHRREQPEAPDQIDRQQARARAARARKCVTRDCGRARA